MDDDDDVAWQAALLTATFFPVVFLLLLANCFPDLRVLSLPPKGSEERRKIPPEYMASVLSTFFFSWLDGLIYRGYKRPLTQDRLPDPPERVTY